MSQIVHRIDQQIVSNVVNRHHQWFQYYYELKDAVSALMDGEREYDISCSTVYGLEELGRYHGVCRVYPAPQGIYRSGRRLSDKPTAKNAPPRYPLLMESGFALDRKIVSAKVFISAYETGMRARGRPLSHGYMAAKQYAMMSEPPNYRAITDHLGIKSVIRITFNMNYEG
ncbi:hypothetical protein MAG26fr_orf036 [Klebsiella phage vB_KpnS_MAG26fr]|nr:hypothetical protein MAG26fr_orf036 [Klebsiella phage vB_KpnS_MAG26fr]